MILNIDLGSLYLKSSVVDKNKIIKSEVIRMEKNTFSVIEVLIISVINTYTSQYPIKSINLIPNLGYLEFQLINSEAIVDSKYQLYMKQQIKKEQKEKKRELRMGSEYAPMTSKSDNQGLSDINFQYNLLDYEVFHTRERTTLMESDILLEYINKDYLNFLIKIVNKLGKEVSIISPLRVMRCIPFPIGPRIVINYGHKNILYVVINQNNNIVYVKKESTEPMEDLSPESLLQKHSQLKNPNTIHYGIKSRIQELVSKYEGYELYTVGGNANYLQEDMQIKNRFVGFQHNDSLPLVIENLLINTGFSGYTDLQYNNSTMNLKNKIFSLLASTGNVSNTAIAVTGDVIIAALILILISGYKVNSEYLKYNKELQSVTSQIEQYQGSSGRIVKLEEHLDNLRVGKVKNYYNIAEVLNTIESPMQIEKLEITNDSINIVAYADNTALIYQFLNTVKLRQSTNYYTNFTLEANDIRTVYKNGAKLDRVELTGRLK